MQNSPSIHFKFQDSNQKSSHILRSQQFSYNLSVTNKGSTYKKQFYDHPACLNIKNKENNYSNTANRNKNFNIQKKDQIQSSQFFQKFDKMFKVCLNLSPQYAKQQQIQNKLTDCNSTSLNKTKRVELKKVDNNKGQEEQKTKKFVRKNRLQHTNEEEGTKKIIKNEQPMKTRKTSQKSRNIFNSFPDTSLDTKTIKFKRMVSKNSYKNKQNNQRFQKYKNNESNNPFMDIINKKTCHLFKQGLRSGTLQNWKRKFHQKMKSKESENKQKPTVVRGRFYKKVCKMRMDRQDIFRVQYNNEQNFGFVF